MIQGRPVAILIIFAVFLFPKIKCTNTENEAVSTESAGHSINSSPHSSIFVNLTAIRIDPATARITWKEIDKFQNVTIQFRQVGRSEWRDLIASSTHSPSSNYITLPDPCENYEIRLRFSTRNNKKVKNIDSETIPISNLSIPDRLQPIKPSITKNTYDNRTDTIELEFSIENYTLSTWPLNWRNLTTEVHVVDCGDRNFAAPVPTVTWLSNFRGTFRFPAPYASAVKSGRLCQVMLSIREPAKLCGRPVQIDGELLDNAVIIDLNCDNTENIHCPPPAEFRHKMVSSPRCNPDFVDASQITSLDSNHQPTVVQLRLRWDFDKNKTTNTVIPDKILLRFGYTDVPATADPLLAVLVPMREIDRFEASGHAKNTTVYTNKSTQEPNFDQSDGQRFYRISICALYGNDSAAEEGKINWAIIPTFAVKVTQNNSQTNPQKQCRCEEFGSLTQPGKIAAPPVRDIEITPSTTAPPAIVSSPSAHEYENFWAKAAPLLAVFTVMTLINIILLMVSCFYYKKAKSLNAMK